MDSFNPNSFWDFVAEFVRTPKDRHPIDEELISPYIEELIQMKPPDPNGFADQQRLVHERMKTLVSYRELLCGYISIWQSYYQWVPKAEEQILFYRFIAHVVDFPNDGVSTNLLIDKYVYLLEQTKDEIRRQQIKARFMPLECFTENTSEYYEKSDESKNNSQKAIDLRDRYQLLLRYLLCKPFDQYLTDLQRTAVFVDAVALKEAAGTRLSADRQKAANLIFASTVTEWEVPISGHEAQLILREDRAERMNRAIPNAWYWDRAPFSISRVTAEEVFFRKWHPGYRIRILALETPSEDAAKSMVRRAEARTIVVNENGDDRGISLIVRKPESERGKSADLKRGSSSRSSNFSTDDRHSNTSFWIGSKQQSVDDVYVMVQPDEYIFHPTDRTIGDFVSRHGNLMFKYDNVAIFSCADPGATEFRLRTSLSLDIRNPFDPSEEIKIRTGSFCADPTVGIYQYIESHSFQAVSNKANEGKALAPLVWKVLLKAYAENAGDARSYLRWEEVKEFLINFVSWHTESKVRRLTEMEIQNLTGMILRIRMQRFVSMDGRKKSFDLTEKSDQKALIDNLLKLNPSIDSLLPFLTALDRLLFRAVLKDNNKIHLADFQDKCVSVDSNGQLIGLDFSLFAWLFEVARDITGSSLHSEESNKTLRLFNERFLTLNSAVDNKKAIDRFVKPMDGEEKVKMRMLMIRFGTARLNQLAFDVFDPTVLPPDNYGDHGVHRVSTKDTEEISKTKFHGQVDDRSKEELRTEGVVNSKGQIQGLYAVLRRGYAAKITTVIKLEPKPPSTEEQGRSEVRKLDPRAPKKKQKDPVVVIPLQDAPLFRSKPFPIYMQANSELEPMYKLNAATETFGLGEISLEQGPRQRGAAFPLKVLSCSEGQAIDGLIDGLARTVISSAPNAVSSALDRHDPAPPRPSPARNNATRTSTNVNSIKAKLPK